MSVARGLTKAEIQALSIIPHRQTALQLGLFWAALIGIVQLQVWLGLGLWTLPLMVLAGCLQNGLILWTHEGAHVNLHRNKRKNDFWSDLLICGPIGVYLEAYRWHHGRHHRHLGDPNEEVELSAYYCIRGSALFQHMFRHLSGWVAYTVLFRRQRNTGGKTRFDPPPPRSRASIVGLLALNGALLLLCALQGAWWMYVVAWAFPLGTIAPMVSNFRTIVEHQPSSEVCETGMQTRVVPITRVVECGPLEKLLIAPVGFAYHYEHHLYPGLPYTSLPRVRQLLAERGHYEQVDTVRSRGYLRTIWRLSMRPGYGVRTTPERHTA